MISSADSIVIALGANLSGEVGTPQETLSTALRRLERLGVVVKRRSRWWRTPAFPPGSGPDFVNAAALVETALEPESLLAALHQAEAELGRERRDRWGARVIDLDLLCYGARIAPNADELRRWVALAPEAAATESPPNLLLPHPRLHERGFVLAPMAEAAPDWRHPLLGLTVAELLERLPPEALDGVEPIEEQTERSPT